MNQNTSRIYTHDEVNNIVSNYINGSSLTAITKKFQRKRDNIKKILVDNNVWKENPIKEGDKNIIIKLYTEKNLSLQKVSEITHYSKEQIRLFLKKENLIRKGLSNGVKIILSDKQKNLIQDLYLKSTKTLDEIAIEIGITKGFLNKFLSTTGYRRNDDEAFILGKNIHNCKTFIVNGLRCQGTYEKFYIEFLIEQNEDLPIGKESIETPYGMYYPDFTFGYKVIEIKSQYTYDILIGLKRNKYTGDFDSIQYDKINWVNENVKPVDIIVVDKKNKKLIKKNIK